MKKFRLVVFAALILAIVAGYLFLPAELRTIDGLKQQKDSFLSLVEARPWSSALAFFGLYIAVTALSLPGAAVLTLAGGAIFGLVKGFVLVSFASSIGALLAFLVGRFLFREWVEARFRPSLRKINNGIEREGNFYLFALRLVPIFPFFVINLVMALTSIKAWSFYWVSQVGMIPGTIAYVYAGTQLATIESPGDVLSWELLSAFVVLGLLPLFTKRLLDWLRRRKVSQKFDKPESFDYNLVVIGAGSAGLVSSYIASTVKAKVALIERHKMGGDCLNTGCVPSKALIRTGKAVHEMHRAAELGLRSGKVEFDFAEVMERVHSIIQKIEPHDSVERYTKLGVDVLLGDAFVRDPFRVEVDGKVLTTQNIVIATGGKPFVPDFKGLDQVRWYTSDTIWELRERPERLLVLGGGPIGSELTQAFHRLGCRVTQVERGERLLGKEDSRAGALVQAQFESEGITVLLRHSAEEFGKDEDGAYLVCREKGESESKKIHFDAVLIALGRRANTAQLVSEKLELQLRDNGTVWADDYLRTSIPNIYVAGDVTGPMQFTHFGAHQAWFAVVNALFGFVRKFRADYRVIPRCTFTDPEVAHVGKTESELQEEQIQYEVTEYELDDLDRAIADSDDRGFVKVFTAQGSDKILGALIVGAHAGEMLAEFTLAMKHRLGLGKILGTVHTYPTFSEAAKYAAGNWKKAHKPEWALTILERLHRWRRNAA